MKGSYAHVGADGLPYMIDWFADDEGVHPSAPHPSKYVELVSDHAGEVVDTNINTSEAESEDMLSDEVFSISGNDSQLQDRYCLEALNE